MLCENDAVIRRCENVASESKTRKKQARTRSLRVVNEQSEPVFDAVLLSAVVLTGSAAGFAEFLLRRLMENVTNVVGSVLNRFSRRRLPPAIPTKSHGSEAPPA